MRRTARDLAWQVPALFLVGALGFGACGDGSESEAIEVADADTEGCPDDLARDLEVGDELQVTLGANRTTGYQWAVVQTDDEVLRLSGEPVYEESEASGSQVGVGGMTTFTFEAVGTGDVDLELGYQRSFEPEEGPVETCTVSVTVS